MKKRIISVVLLIAILLVTFNSAYATPPANPHIGSGSNPDGGSNFEYLSSSGWTDLYAPPHWVIETGEIAYCVDHKADSPIGNEVYSAFNPQALYSSRTYYGLLAILKAGYPFQTGGLSSKQARYVTANAIRAWLSESAGIGYNFMNLSNGYVRAKSGQEAVYNFMVTLVNKARNNIQPVFSISTNPSNVKLNVQGNNLVGQTTIVFSNINGYYSIDGSKLPSGVTISGYTGENGDVLTISAPTSYAGQSISLSNILEAHDTRASSNLYWFESSSGEQPVLVPVTDTMKPVTSGSMSFYSEVYSGQIEIIKKDAVSDTKLGGAVYRVMNASNQEVEILTTNVQGYAMSGKLATGKYSLQEILAPYGYLIDTTIHGNISVIANKTTTVNLTDQKANGMIRIHKTNANSDMGNHSLDGAVFEIRNSSNNLVDTVITNSQGRANSKSLPLGTYTIKEIAAPNGFLLNTNVFTAKLVYAGQTASFVADDIFVTEQPQTGIIRVTKTNDNPDMGSYSLSGAVFEIRNENGTKVATITTDSGGKAQTDELPLGPYTVKEKTAPTGYQLNAEIYTVTLPYADQTTSIVYKDVTVPEQPQVGVIRITKTNAKTDMGSYSLNGAIFEILNSNNELVDTVITDNQGRANSKNLPLGAYTFKEISAPNGFVLNTNIFTANLEYSSQMDGVVYDDITVAEEPQTGIIRITKTNDNPSMGNYQLSGAAFEIHDRNNKLVDTATTDNQGKVTTINLPLGIYKINEVTAPYGYVLNEKTHTAELQYGGQSVNVVYTDVTVSEQPQVGKIRIVKTNTNPDMGSYNLSGAVFEIRDSNDKLVDTITTDSQGKATSKSLPLGIYTAKEITAPNGFILNSKTFIAKLEYGEQTVSVVYDDIIVAEQPQTGIVRVMKANDNSGLGSYPLSGAVFDVRSEDGTKVATITTDSGSKAQTNELPLGKYTVKEVTAPFGYVINNTVYDANLQYSGQTVSVVYDDVTVPNNPQTGTIRITKHDSETGNTHQGDASLEGAVFAIYNAEGEFVEQLECETKTDATSGELPLGEYTVKELITPIGYTLNDTEYSVEITYSDQTVEVNRKSIIISDDVIEGRISIAKFAEEGLAGQGNMPPKPPLEGIEFEVCLKSTGTLVDTLTTNSDGLVTSALLPYGTYTVTETKTTDGYLPCKPFEVFVDENGKTYNYIIENKVIKADVRIIKIDNITGDVIQIAGTAFQIKDADGNLVVHHLSYPEPKEIDTFMTDESGTLKLPQPLKFGEYELIEVNAPYGYVLNDNSLSFTVDGIKTLIEIEFENSPTMGIITVEKTGSMFSSANKQDTGYGAMYEPVFCEQHLEGAVFEVRNVDDELVDTITTDSDGMATTKQLPLGTYTLIETYAPDGFVLDGAPIEVTLEYENHHVAVVTVQVGMNNNRQNVDIRLTKEREVIDWNTLEYRYIPAGKGFVFGLFANEDLVNKSGDIIIDKDSLIATSETNEDGEVSFNIELPYASYYVRELEAPRIYEVDSTRYEFEVSYAGMSEDVIIVAVNDGEPIQNNLIKKTLQVIKVDSRNNRSYLQGAVFKLRNSQGDLLQTFTTDQQGKAVSIDLPMGDYTFTEIKAPTGYVLDDLGLSVTISDDENQVYTVTGENTPTKVKITKTDISDDTPLPNAHIEIFSKNGELVFEGNTNKSGALVIHELPVGSYTFRETAAPIGYTLNTITFEFNILEDGTIIGATNIQDTPTKVIISKSDVTDGKPLPNAEIEILNIDGESVFKGKADENGEIAITHLPVGSYTFIETKAPDGYILSIEKLEFNIDEFGEITGEIQMTNSPTALNIFKVKYEDNLPLTGAGFKVKNWFELNTLSFTLNADGTYRYDADGDIKEILVDKNGEAVVYGLPLGNYWLEESIVPAGYYPAAPAKITIGETNSINVPFEAVIPNSVFVKLGLDRDRYNIPIVISLAFLALAGLAFFFVRRKRRKGKS